MNVHSVGKKCTIDSSYYIDKCLKAVVEELKWERPLSGTHGIKLLHDNAKAHDAQNYLKEQGITIMPHPPYSPDLSPCDYWLNDYIKQHLPDEVSEKSLHNAVTKIVFDIPKKEYKKTFDREDGALYKASTSNI